MIYKKNLPGSSFVTLEDIRKENPNTSFPESVSDETLLGFGYYRVVTTPPAFDDSASKLQQEGEVFVDGECRLQYSVVTISPEEQVAKMEFVKNNLIMQIQDRMEKFVQSRGYDSLLSACSYATSKVPKFQAEGQYCVDLRDATWTKAMEIMQKAQEGETPVPSIDAVFEALPSMKWPV